MKQHEQLEGKYEGYGIFLKFSFSLRLVDQYFFMDHAFLKKYLFIYLLI